MGMMIEKRDSERGSALLLTLGILSLILVLAMGFAYSANNSLRVAKVQGASNDARAIVDGAADSLLTDMQYMFAERESDGSGKMKKHLAYPSEELTDQKKDDLPQNVIMFSTFPSGSSTSGHAYRQQYICSTDLGRSKAIDKPNPYEQYYVGRLFSMAKHSDKDMPQGDKDGKFPEDTMVSSDVNTSWYSYTTLPQDTLSYLPQLRPIVPALKGKLGFAPPLMIDYSLGDGSTLSNGSLDGDSHTSIVGRYAYIVLEESNKLDVNSVISLTGHEPSALDYPPPTSGPQPKLFVGGDYCDRLIGAADYAKKANGSHWVYNIFETVPATVPYKEDSTLRWGLVPEEIEINATYATDKIGNTEILHRLSDHSTMGWQSYQQLWDKMSGIYRPVLSSSSDMMDLFTLTFFSMTEPESYLVRGTQVDLSDSTEYARFDLTGSSWGLTDTSHIAKCVVDSKFNVAPLLTGWHGPEDPSVGEGEGAISAPSETTADYLTRSRQLVRNLCGYNNNTSGALERDQLEFWDNEATRTPHYMAQKWEVGGTNTKGKGYIDWLHRMVGDDGENVGLQVAANIKDYSDSDDMATWQTETGTLEPSGTAFPKVLYCGNERVSYINEVQFKQSDVVMTQEETQNADGTTSLYYSYDIKLHAGIEMLNIYCEHGATTTGNCDVPIGDVKVRAVVDLKAYRWEYEKENKDDPNSMMVPKSTVPEEYKDNVLPGGKAIVIEFSKGHGMLDKNGNSITEIPNVHMGYTSFFFLRKLSSKSDFDPHFTQLLETDGEKYHYVFKVDIKDVQVISCDSNDPQKIYDVASLAFDAQDWANNKLKPTLGKGGYTDDLPIANLTEPGLAFLPFSSLKTMVDFQCIDARCNHRSGGNFWGIEYMIDGVWNKDNKVGWETIDGDNYCWTKTDSRKKNLKDTTNCTDVTGDKDLEVNIAFVGPDLKSYSTAYIANRPMRSLWELGAIHRGYPNQTINLKMYTDGTTNTAINYGAGDAGILDQVKIGPLLFMKGKINGNQRNPIVWKTLLQDLDNRWYDGTTTVLDCFQNESDFSATLGSIWAKFNNQTAWNGVTSTSLSRVEVPVKMLRNVCAFQNDRDYESIIGRTAQLLTSRADAYTLLVVSESLRDLELVDNSGNTLAGMPSFADLRHTFANPVLVKAKKGSDYKDFPCEVTGRQKVMMHVIRDPWKNRFKVVGKRYLEDW